MHPANGWCRTWCTSPSATSCPLAWSPRWPAGPASTPGAFRSYVPGAGSLRPSVTVGDDGVADVEFSASFAKLSDQQRDRLSAQIVWTLRSVLGLRGVRIFGGTPVLSARGERVHPIDSWGAYGPRSGDNHTYALVDDKLVEIDGDTVQPVTGRMGSRCRRRGRGVGQRRRRGRAPARRRPGAHHRSGRQEPARRQRRRIRRTEVGPRRPPLAGRPPGRLDAGADRRGRSHPHHVRPWPSSADGGVVRPVARRRSLRPRHRREGSIPARRARCDATRTIG